MGLGRVARIGLAAVVAMVLAVVGLSMPTIAVGSDDPFAAAKASGERVELESLRTETETVFARPDGLTEHEISNVPIRVNRDGRWVDVDHTLVKRADGSIGPKASVVEISVGDGDGRLLSTIDVHGVEVTQLWLSDLPEPELRGSQAIYSDVFPDVDLVMTAHDAGLSQVLVVKNATAAANPALRSLDLVTTTSAHGDLIESNGGFVVVDETQRKVGEASAPMMWDSAGQVIDHQGRVISDSSSAAITARTSGPASGDRITAVDLTLDENTLILEPPRSALLDSSVVYPVFIDPTTTNATRAEWAMVFKEYPTTKYYKWTDSGGQGVGYQNYSGVTTKRLFWEFTTPSLAGRTVISAAFKAKMVHSASCTKTPVIVYRTGAISSSTTWNNQPSWSTKQDTITDAAGRDGCTPAGKTLTWNVKQAAQYAADNNSTTITLGMKASETTPTHWKRFLHTATLTIISNAPPVTSDLNIDNDGCGVLYGARDTVPVASAVVNDADAGDLVRTIVEFNAGTTISNPTIITDEKYYASGTRIKTNLPIPKTSDGKLATGAYVFG